MAVQRVIDMGLTFVFADTSDTQLWKQYQPVSTYFGLPSEAYQLPTCRQQVLNLAEFVASLTRSAL